MLNMEKPKTLKELQTLTDLIVKTIKVKGKFKVVINPKLKRFYGKAKITHYIRHGRKIIEIGKFYLENCALSDLINTIIHEIAHFEQTRTRKMRRYGIRRY